MMTLVLRANPYLLAGNRASGPTRTFGSRVFTLEFFRAMFDYGSYERYCVIGVPPGPAREDIVARYPAARERVIWVGHDEIDRIRAMPDPVLAEVQAHFLHNRLLRRLLSARREWPITGFVFSLNSQIFPIWLLQIVLGDVQPWDALICPTTAGRQVIDQYIDLLPDLFPELRAIGPLKRFECPVIPLGSEPVREDAGRRHTARQRFGVAPDDTVILYLGRFSPSSKCDLAPLIAAFSALDASVRQRTRLVIAGDDHEQRLAAALSRIAANLGCAASVMVVPNPSDEERAELYAAADLFVSPSDNLQETFGLTIIEAMAASLPVVASDWNGYRDLVVHGETGFLVPTHWARLDATLDVLCAKDLPCGYGVDHPSATVVDIDEMRRALAVLVTDAERRRAMGARARKVFLERYQWKVVVGRYEALWNELQARARQCFGARSDTQVARQLSPQRVFAHYPTTMFDDGTLVKPGAMSGHLDALWSWADSAIPPGGAIEAARAILGECSRRGDGNGEAALPSIGEIVDWAMAAGAGTELTARLIVTRLIKYDVLSAAGKEVRRS